MSAASASASARAASTWRGLTTGYLAREQAEPRPADAVAREAKNIQTLIRHLDVDVDARVTVTLPEIEARIAALALAESSRKRYRSTARALWRWATAANVLMETPVTATERPADPLDPLWAAVLRDFASGQRAAAYEPATIDRRVRHLRRFALEVDLRPGEVTWERYRDALDGLPVSASTRATHRDSLRAFYRWAVKTNRILEDPTKEPSLRAEVLRASPAWEAEFAAYRRAMRAIGRLESTVRARLSQLRRLARRMGDAAPYRVTADDLLDLLAGFRWGSESRKSHISALRSFFGWAKLAGRTKRNPAKRLPAVRLEVKVVAPASDDAYAEALAKADPSDRLALRLAGECGLRCAEIASTTGRHLRGVEGDWWLLVEGKGQKQREVPLSDQLAHLLRGSGAWAFRGEHDGHISPRALGRRLNRLLPDGVTLHKLRHRFADRAYAADRDVFAVQALLGHSSPATTRRYVRSNQADLRRAAAAACAVR